MENYTKKIIGIFLLVIGLLLFFYYLYVRHKNKSTLRNDLSEHERQKIKVLNKNFTLFLAVAAIIVSVLIYTSDNSPFDNLDNKNQTASTDNIITTSYNEYTYEIPTESPNKADPHDTTTEQSIVKTTDIEEQSAIETTVSTYENYGNNIISDDCTLSGTFSSSNTEICYTLHSTYSNVYGFTFYTDNVNLSYTMVITDEKGNEQYSYNIYSDGISEAPEFSKNTTYYITLKADEGYPKFKISINYPKSDKFN